MGSGSAYDALGWTLGNGLNDPAKAVADFQSAVTGWSGNIDALVGLSAARLSMMKSDGIFHFNDALGNINSAINAPGDYLSSPAHDKIGEVDLQAYRAFINYLNGNSASARSEASNIQTTVDTSGNDGSVDTIGVILAFTN